ncbi:MAG: hypothetical protein C0625_04305 [Arcobacter sp.]|nr:MAG: hypothetical protein C0625_04305 [Arcobacter sp.]
MRRGARDSQVINNFFSFATIIIIAVVLTLYTKYIVQDKEKNPKKQIVKLECEKEAYTYIKVFNQKVLNKSIKALDKGYYKLDGGFIESEYMKSNIKNIVTLDEVDKFYIDSIGTLPKQNIENFLKIQYEVIENDKKKPNKKDADIKLNSGSIKTSFRINSKEIFRVYTDFAFMYKNAIKQRVECSIKVFKNHVQK